MINMKLVLMRRRTISDESLTETRAAQIANNGSLREVVRTLTENKQSGGYRDTPHFTLEVQDRLAERFVGLVDKGSRTRNAYAAISLGLTLMVGIGYYIRGTTEERETRTEPTHQYNPPTPWTSETLLSCTITMKPCKKLTLVLPPGLVSERGEDQIGEGIDLTYCSALDKWEGPIEPTVITPKTNLTPLWKFLGYAGVGGLVFLIGTVLRARRQKDEDEQLARTAQGILGSGTLTSTEAIQNLRVFVGQRIPGSGTELEQYTREEEAEDTSGDKPRVFIRNI